MQRNMPQTEHSPSPFAEGYKTAEAFMEDLRAGIFEYDFKPIPRPSYRPELEALRIEEEEQSATDIRLFLGRLPVLDQEADSSADDGLRPNTLDELIRAYRNSTAKMIGQVGAAAILLAKKYNEPAFKQIFSDQELRGQVIRYIHRNHRRAVWMLARGQLKALTATDANGSFALYHPAKEIDRLREEYHDLGGAVDFMIGNSPRMVHAVLQRTRQDCKRLVNDKRYADFKSETTIRSIILRNPKAPEAALSGAIKVFRELVSNPKYAIFGTARIRNMVATSPNVQSRLDSALKRIDKLMKDPDCNALGRRFLARAYGKYPKKFESYIGDVVGELKKITDSGQFPRFSKGAIAGIISENPKDGWNLIVRADAAMERIEADPECIEFGIYFMPPSMLRHPDPYKSFKDQINRYKELRKQSAFAAMSDSSLKEYAAGRNQEENET